MGLLVVRLVFLAALVYVGYRVLRSFWTPGTRRGRVPCETCRHARKVFDDGTLCTFGDKETFKNAVHVANCMDYEQR